MTVDEVIALLQQHPGHWTVKSGLLQPVTGARGNSVSESVVLDLQPRSR